MGCVAPAAGRLSARRGFQSRRHLAAVNKVDRRIENHLIAPLHAGVHFYPRPQIARHSHLAELRLAILYSTLNLLPRLFQSAERLYPRSGFSSGFFSFRGVRLIPPVWAVTDPFEGQAIALWCDWRLRTNVWRGITNLRTQAKRRRVQ